MHVFTRTIIIGVSLFTFLAAWSAADQFENLAPKISYLEADRDVFTIDSIRETSVLDKFQPLQGMQFSQGYTGGKDHWLRIDLGGPDNSGWKAMEFNNPRLGEVTLFYLNSEGAYQDFTLGTRHNFWTRQIGGLAPAFPIRLRDDEAISYFVRIRHFGSLRFEVGLRDLNTHNRHTNRTLAFYLLLSGALITLAAYNLCVYLHLRQHSYLWLTFFLVSLNFNLMATSGTANMLLWPDPSWLSYHSMTLTTVLALFTGIGFATHFLRKAPGAPLLNRIAVSAGCIAVLGMIGTFFQIPVAFYVIIVGSLLAAAAASYLSARAVWARQPFALAFLCCWGLLFLGVFITCLLGPGFISSTPLTENFTFLATLPAAVGWSFSLTSQIKMHELEQRALLEQKVEDRTTALKQAVEEVKTLHELLPICCSCKKVRDDEGYWQHLETYLQTHMSTDVSHGICPDCATNLYPNYFPESLPDADQDPPRGEKYL